MHPVVNAFHTAVNAKRDAIFDDDRLTPVSAMPDAMTPAPGWVGKNWKSGGTLLMAINPGGGGDNYRVNPTDARLYGLIRDFRDAKSTEERLAGLRGLSDAWIQIQASHNIRRIIDAVFKALGTNAHQTAFLNVLPFRTVVRALNRIIAKIEKLAPGSTHRNPTGTGVAENSAGVIKM